MAVEKARAHLEQWNRGADVIEFEASTATVDEAAAALGTEAKYIAKSLSFRDGESAMLVVTAGDAKIDNRKFKGRFGFKVRTMWSALPVSPSEEYAPLGWLSPSLFI